jgi:type 1 glutamine amidotransferase
MPSFGLSARLRPRRLRIAPAAVGCKPDGRRSIGGFPGPATGRSPGRRAALVADDDALVVVKLCSGRLAVDVVMFAPTSGELPLTDAQKAALLDFVHRGGGFIGIHSATDTLYDWPDYGRLVGAYFKAHSWAQVATVTVEDRAHPTTTAQGASFAILEEFYTFRENPRSSVHVLLSLDVASVGASGDYPLAWTQTVGAGRTYYNLQRARTLRRDLARPAVPGPDPRSDPLGRAPLILGESSRVSPIRSTSLGADFPYQKVHAVKSGGDEGL